MEDQACRCSDDVYCPSCAEELIERLDAEMVESGMDKMETFDKLRRA